LRSRPADAPTKLDKKWTFPFRVTEVQDRGRRAMVVSLLDRSVERDVHISNVKFVNPPTTIQQEVQWEQERLHEATELRLRHERAQRALDQAIIRSEGDFTSRFAS
jgi:regulator of protease activity HflC (stomatin/prohibitin superfamily)